MICLRTGNNRHGGYPSPIIGFADREVVADAEGVKKEVSFPGSGQGLPQNHAAKDGCGKEFLTGI